MMTVAQLPREVREVVDLLTQRLGQRLKAILWHGSWARGEARPDSDHDLIIILRHIDDDVLLRLQDIFLGRPNWSTFVQSQEELRQFPSEGRLQLAYGWKLLYGDFDGIEVKREHLLDEIRSLARLIRFECRYRLLHEEREYGEMDKHYRGFLRARNARMLFYAAKMAVQALKARELLAGRSYPLTRGELRQRLTDPDDIAIVDLVEDWPLPREAISDELTPLILQLDAFARKLVAELPEASA